MERLPLGAGQLKKKRKKRRGKKIEKSREKIDARLTIAVVAK